MLNIQIPWTEIGNNFLKDLRIDFIVLVSHQATAESAEQNL